MRVARWSKLGPLAWTYAAAFGGAAVDQLQGASESRRSDVVSRRTWALRFGAATVLLPCAFLFLSSARLRRGLYAADDNRSLVVVKRLSSGKDAVTVVGLIALPLVAWIAVLLGALRLGIATGTADVYFIVTGVATAVFGTLLVWLILGLFLLLITSLRRGRAISSTGPETPTGERWVVESLAARAQRDGAAAFRLAVRVVGSLPPDKVLAAVARTDRLKEAYMRLGFEQGDLNRLYMKT